MKKIFTLLAVLICTVLANAQTYEFYYNGTTKTYRDNDSKTFFTVAGDDKSTSASITTFILPGTETTINTTKGLKVNSSGSIKFDLEGSATLTAFISATQSPNNLPGLNGEAFENTDLQTVPDGFTNIRILQKKLTAGSYEFSYKPQNKEICLVYIGVVLDEVSGTKIETPFISFNETTGEVTISAVENATKVVYTTDGSMPTEDSTEYTEPFTVADGTVVKAMAIGDGTEYANSSVAEVTVVLTGLTCEAPVINQFNGTFALSTTTALASCEYSLDGETWIPYTIPVTLAETTTVKARATRANWTTSEVVEAEIETLPLQEGTKTVYLGAGAFEIVAATQEEGGILKGLETDVAAGYSIQINTTGKKGWSKSDKITIADGLTRTSYYGSNGAQNIVTLPEGVTVYRVTFYSYMPTLGRVSGWNEVAGVSYNQYKDIPLLSQDPTKPDVRVFNLDGVTDSFTFAQTGERPNFVMVLEVVDLRLSAPWQSGNKESYELGERIYLLHEDPEATIIYTLDGGKPDENNIYTAPAAAPARVAAATDEDHAGKTYNLAERPIVFNGEPLNISYKAIKDGHIPSAIQTLVIDGNGQTTGIENVAVDSQNARVEFFNLQGVRVENPSAGIFIRRQGNNVSKVIVK